MVKDYRSRGGGAAASRAGMTPHCRQFHTAWSASIRRVAVQTVSKRAQGSARGVTALPPCDAIDGMIDSAPE